MTDAAPHRVRSEAKAPSHLYLEDFAVGQVYEAGPIPVSAEAIKAYARQFDPQPFHTDEELARSTFFQGLVASGWHTASLTMSLVVQALPIAGGVIGGGVDELRWPKPLRPGDELRFEGEIVEVRPSRTKPIQGLVRVRTTTLNQDGQAVQTMIANLVVPRRPMERA
jgi:acyl dehydratase